MCTIEKTCIRIFQLCHNNNGNDDDFFHSCHHYYQHHPKKYTQVNSLTTHTTHLTILANDHHPTNTQIQLTWLDLTHYPNYYHTTISYYAILLDIYLYYLCMSYFCPIAKKERDFFILLSFTTSSNINAYMQLFQCYITYKNKYMDMVVLCCCGGEPFFLCKKYMCKII